MDIDDPIERPPEDKALLSDRELLQRIEEHTDSLNLWARFFGLVLIAFLVLIGIACAFGGLHIGPR